MFTEDQFVTGAGEALDHNQHRASSTRVAPINQAGQPVLESGKNCVRLEGTMPVLVVDSATAASSRGMAWQLYSQVRGLFVETLRRQHIFLSIFMARGEAQVLLTLSQRVTVGVPRHTPSLPQNKGLHVCRGGRQQGTKGSEVLQCSSFAPTT